MRDDPAQKRLLDAVSVQLNEVLVAKDIEDIPEELQERIMHLYKTVTEKGSYVNTIPEMDSSQVQKVIREIIAL